ncbi:MAG: nucleotide exchange factor GrpE [Thermotogota bacterium]
MKTAIEKVQNLQEEKKILITEIERLKEIEQYAYKLKSDFEHYKQIVQKDKQRIYENATIDFLDKMIPVLTNFERALSFMNVENPSKETAMIIKGVQMIYQSFMMTLQNDGLEEIVVTPGMQYDPFKQEIAEQVVDHSYEEHTILEIVEKGYKYKKTVLKPAKVKITIKESEEKKEENQSGEEQ